MTKEEIGKKISEAKKGKKQPWAAKNGFKKGNTPWNKGIPTPRGEKASHWKGDDVGYLGLHAWLNRTFGKADRCENMECKKKSITYEWALRKGYEYQRRRVNFFRLCVSCHRIYDDVINRGWKTRKS